MATSAPSGSGEQREEGRQPPVPTSLAGRELEDAICNICEGSVTDPVTFECGHSCCRGCLGQRRAGMEVASCPRCEGTCQEGASRDSTQGAQETPARRGQVRRQEPAPSAAEPTVARGVPGMTEIPREFTVDVTLDPDTAHPNLVLSEDRKRVRLGDTRQDLPDTPERFDLCVCVLGAEGFVGGRCYWEVEVGDKPAWDLGVCRESVSRKGTVTSSPGAGYWLISLGDREYKALTWPLTPISVSARPSRVGVFLDYEAGEVSFYNVTDGSHLFTFTDTFSGTLRPFFSPGLNAAPLTICPVPAQAGEDPSPAREERGAQQGEPSDSPSRAEAAGREEEIPLCSSEAGNTPSGPR
ncbi:E3 ubiquitin-protein ligase TRIM39-like [Pelodiscus sinensis]|uniref:E3 ubiquitin-protein ligase TRIM39-like n=1 Tax=Pelodiscus sinensis TaxID=13735 RepID=UPI003F6ABB7A